MIRFIMPVVLIVISAAVFFMFSNPLYNSTDPLSPGIVALNAQVATYDEALNNSKALENERDKLTAKDNSISLENKIKLQKLLPENIDNIRLILEIEKIALPFGMSLKNVKYSPAEESGAASNQGVVVQGGGVAQSLSKDYGVWDLSFSTTGSYNNFLNFTRALESNLRIVDISSIEFSSDTGAAVNSILSESYTYNFNIKTYWLKN